MNLGREGWSFESAGILPAGAASILPARSQAEGAVHLLPLPWRRDQNVSTGARLGAQASGLPGRGHPGGRGRDGEPFVGHGGAASRHGRWPGRPNGGAEASPEPRRRAIGGRVATQRLLPAALVALLSAGCAGQQATAPGAGEGPQGAPQRGGTLRIAIDNDPGGMDIHKTGDGASIALLTPLTAQLIRNVPNDWNEIEADLATKWGSSGDGQTWTFTLKQDAKWHDGKPITADDIVYTVNRISKPPPGFRGGSAGCMKEMVDAASRVDTATVAIKLNAPSVAFLQCLSMAYVRMQAKHILEPVDVQENSRELRPAELAGSGPFQFVSYERGSTWVMNRNDAYHVAGRPYLDGVTFFFIPDVNTQMASLKAGQLDMIMALRKATQAKDLVASAGDRIVAKKAENPSFFFLTFNLVSGPFQDVRLRRAVHLALNRQEMIEFIHEGEGSLTTHLCHCWSYIYDEKYYLTRPGFRPDKTADKQEAKRLVDEATGGRGLDVVFTHRMNLPSPEFVLLERQQLAEIGIRVSIETLESAVAQDRYRKGQFAVSGEHTSTVPFNDPDSMITRHFLPNADRNWGKWSHQEFNQLHARESVILDQKERATLLRRMADILEQEQPQVALTDGTKYVPMTKAVRDYDKPRTGIADLRWDWVWLAK